MYDNDNDDEIPALIEVERYQVMDNVVSCIQVNNPEVDVVVNTSDLPTRVSVKNSAYGASVVLAPGEGQIPSNLMRELYFDVKALPLIHPSKVLGLHYF